MRVLIFASILFCSIANAADSDIYGTFEVKFMPTTVQGSTQACHLAYKAVIQESAYEQGAVYAVVGNIGVGISEDRKNMLSILKVTVNKIDLKNPNNSIPKKPYFAYLKAPDGVNNAKSFFKGMDSETAGGIFSIYKIDENFTKVYGQMLERQTVAIVFNLAKNSMDIVVPLDLTVESVNEKGQRVHSSKALEEYSKCTRPLYKEVLTNAQKK
jgi:hypothetical protein